MRLPFPSQTPRPWRIAISAGVGLIAMSVGWFSAELGTLGQALLGYFAFLGVAAWASRDLRQVSGRTLAWGIGLQIVLGVLVLKFSAVRYVFELIGEGFKIVIACSDQGADFVFGSLAKPNGPSGFVFAFKALPPIIFVSSLSAVLYHLGILQWVVRQMSRVMIRLMGTSGQETLAVSANVFMGQTEAPLIVKPYVPFMTRSELLALMASGMATISGGMMAIYISYGADPVSILCTSVMACPCALFLTKLVLPEDPQEVAERAAEAKKAAEEGKESPESGKHPNAISAAAAGVKDGLMLALNVAAMLLVFLAFIALADTVLGGIKPVLIGWGLSAESLAWLPDNLNLQYLFGRGFSIVALLMGVEPADSERVGSLLGMKLAANEHVAYLDLKINPLYSTLAPDSRLLAVFALTGFANFASIGIQLGGIGAMAEKRMGDLAQLAGRALFIGFLATLMNAAVAGVLLRLT